MRFAAIFALAVALHAAGPRWPAGLDLYRPVPEDNRLTAAKIALGKRLFNDRWLSRDGSLSCASCHDRRKSFTDGWTVAEGVGGARGERNVPTIVNRAWGSRFLLDGRAATLEEQALLPIFNPKELGMTPEAVLELLRSSRYRSEFLTAFGDEPSLENASRALASYMRTILSGDSTHDRHVLSVSAQRGLGLFRGKARCTACHGGPNFTDEEFHNTGVAWRTGIVTDEGRAAITHVAGDRGAFKTPTLREVSRTAPYMHDGSAASLDEVIEFYDGGGQRNPGLDSKIRPLHLTGGEKQDLLAFLKSLAGRIQDGD